MDFKKEKKYTDACYSFPTAFCDALANNDLETVRSLYNYIKNNNYRYAYLLLYTACKRGSIDAVKLLVEEGKESDFNDGLYGACASNNLKIAKYMVELGATEFNKGLWTACNYNNIDIVKYLVEECKTTGLINAYKTACDNGYLNIVKYLVEECKYKNVADGFVNACINKHLDIVRYLLEECKLNDKSEIHHGFSRACSYGAFNVVEYLVEHNYINELQVGLNYALSNGYYTIAKYLIEKGANTLFIRVECAWELLNMGVDCKKLYDVYEFVEKRNVRNTGIKKVLLEVTVVCTNVIDIVCSFTEF